MSNQPTPTKEGNIVLNVNFYKDTGKYYEGGIVEIPSSLKMWHNDFKEKIWELQNIVRNPGQFIMTTDNPDPAGGFFTHCWIRN